MKVPYLYLLNNTTWLITIRVSRSKLQIAENGAWKHCSRRILEIQDS